MQINRCPCRPMELNTVAGSSSNVTIHEISFLSKLFCMSDAHLVTAHIARWALPLMGMIVGKLHLLRGARHVAEEGCGWAAAVDASKVFYLHAK